MLIVGSWFLGPDGVSRPTVTAFITGSDGRRHRERFLVDSGADRTAFSAILLGQLGLPTSAGVVLARIGGTQPFVSVSGALEFEEADGTLVRVRGSFAAFTDPAATDMSILGRDVLNNFDVIVSRPRNEVLLLAAPHAYRVEPP